MCVYTYIYVAAVVFLDGSALFCVGVEGELWLGCVCPNCLLVVREAPLKILLFLLKPKNRIR